MKIQGEACRVDADGFMRFERRGSGGLSTKGNHHAHRRNEHSAANRLDFRDGMYVE
jgi:hypothetical protein